MTRHLFFTGPIGCGKSTAILSAIGDALPKFGGFLTIRKTDHMGRPARFVLTAPDGSKEFAFLDHLQTAPTLHPDVFQEAIPLLRGSYLVMDEIGGVELLCPQFRTALYAVLNSQVPIIGVIKGDGPAASMIRHMGLTDEYNHAATALRAHLASDTNTTIYPCKQYDPHALALAQAWVKEYAHD